MAQRELLLLAHGKARTVSGLDDLAQDLRSRGKRQAQKLGSWMQQQGLSPDTRIASPALCARTSAEKALKAGGWTAQGILTEPRLYRSPPRDQIATLRACPYRRLLCVAAPGTLSALLSDLVPSAPALGPGMLAYLTHDGDVHSGSARLQTCVDADCLPAGFPYPGPGSTERRDRPAYYYRQSAALPYRMRDGAAELLLITSSSGRKWGIPKGICEPGLSAQDSAAQEALEEAGVLGVMQATCLGSYEQAKWGAMCRVSVYPMRVQRVLSDADWGEDHRRREWVAPQEAAKRVTHPDLARIIAAWQVG